MKTKEIQFSHLHVHSEYSVQDGLARIFNLALKAHHEHMPALALTDHGYMGGIPELFRECNDASAYRAVKPIAGCEIFYGDNYYHLVLLAKNEQGYHNLCHIVSSGFAAGKSKPCVPFSVLEQYHEGLICCSACIGGEIAQHILHKNIAEAQAALVRLRRLFWNDFYLEIQRYQATNSNANRTIIPMQQKVNSILLRMAEAYRVKVIVTNDVHFVEQSDAKAHDYFLCTQFRQKWTDKERLRFSRQEWFKSTEEMQALFSDLPEALRNTQEIVNKIERYSIAHERMLPTFSLPRPYCDADAFLAALVQKGAQQRYGDDLNEDLKDRIQYEQERICSSGCAWYFLVWWDIMRAVRKQGIAVSPGSGDAVWSMVCYCLGITDIDPMQFDLPYERFFPADPHQLPYIEGVFAAGKGDFVLHYIAKKYGTEHVAYCMQYNRLNREQALSRLRNCHEGIAPDQAEEIANELYYKIYSSTLDKTAVFISPLPIEDVVPTAGGQMLGKHAVKVCQYDREAAKYVGLVPFEVASEPTLDVLEGASKYIRDKHGVDIVLNRLPMDDCQTLQLLHKGDTDGVFLLDNDAMRDRLRRQPLHSLGDLVRLYAQSHMPKEEQSNEDLPCTEAVREGRIYRYYSKSHAVGDMYIAYQCAYLKAHYPEEYMQAYRFYQTRGLHPTWLEHALLSKPWIVPQHAPRAQYMDFKAYLKSGKQCTSNSIF